MTGMQYIQHLRPVYACAQGRVLNVVTLSAEQSSDSRNFLALTERTFTCG